MSAPCADDLTPRQAPASLQALQNLVDEVAQGSTDLQLGRKTITALAQAVERPGDFALLTITEAAARYGVSPSTWTRLAARLGYQGFSDFQDVFRSHFALQNRPHFYAQQTTKALRADRHHTAHAPLHDSVLEPLAQSAVDNIHAMVAMAQESQLQRVAARLARAQRVCTFGQRQMHTVSGYLGYGLGLLRSDVSELGQSQTAVAEGLAQLHAGDVLLVTSVAPYTRMVVEVARAAREQGLCVIALTDHRASPLAAAAEFAFFVPHASGFISNSLVAYFVLCEALVNAVAQELGDEALQAVKQRERMIARLAIEQ